MNYKEYLKNHTLDEEFVKKDFAWSFDTDKITIPVYNLQSNLVYKRYRHLSDAPETPKFTSDQGSHPTIYPAFKLKDQPEVFIVEGEPDAVRLWQEGLPAFTATSGVSKFDDALASFFIGREVYLCLDTDSAAKKSITKYHTSFLNVGIDIKIIELPKEYKDISEFFSKGGDLETFKKLKDNAITFKQWIIKENKDLHPIIGGEELAIQEYPHKKWLIDKVIRAEGITLWTGEGGVGKTTLSYTVAKAVAEGSEWLNRFPASKGRVLILDKENDPIDVQTSLRALHAVNKDIFYYVTANDFQFITIKGELTEEAEYLKMYCEENKINLVIMDSLVDFYLGDENSSNDAATNMNAWRKVFQNASILTIHHENKQNPNIKKSASTRSRGSSHLFNGAQGMLSFSVLDESTPEKIKVEHAKVRGARKMKPFEVDMIIEDDHENVGETIITGFKYSGEIQEEVLISQKTKQIIIEFLKKNLGAEYDANEMVSALSNVVGERNVKSVLPELRNSNLIDWRKEKARYIYFYKKTVKNVDEFLENDENF